MIERNDGATTRGAWNSGAVQPTDYRIVVTGELEARYASAFEPMELVVHEGRTEIVGRVEDDAELHGILEAVSALGLSLVSVTPVA